jgi:hypothetical protein
MRLRVKDPPKCLPLKVKKKKLAKIRNIVLAKLISVLEMGAKN